MDSAKMEIDEKAIDAIIENVAKYFHMHKWHSESQQLDPSVLNYVGNIVPVSLVDEETGKTVSFMIKRAPKIPYLEDVIKCFYEREIFVYTTLMPLFKNLNTTIDLGSLFPKCFYVDLNPDKRLLALENMIEKGFYRFKGQYLDAEHLSVSLKALARFHALSFVMTERHIEVPDKYTLRPFLDNDPVFYCNIIKYVLRKYLPMFVNTKYEGFFKKLNANIAKYISESVLKTKGRVFCHGDYWKENILFQYHNNQPSEACILDFQITRVLSPVYDVLFFIMTCADSPVRRYKFSFFLSCYYETLGQCLKKEGIDPEEVYSEKDFTHDLKLVFPLSFAIALFSFILWSGMEDIDSLYLEKEKILPRKEMEQIKSKTERMILDLLEDFTYLGFMDF